MNGLPREGRRLMGRSLSCWAAILGLGVLLIRPAFSEPVRARVIEHVSVDDTGESLVIHARFTFPLQYLSHFPSARSDQLRIRFRPMALSQIDGRSALRREAAPLPAGDLGALRTLTYEGDVLGGPVLTLQFQRPVWFSVEQGVDLRSLSITISEASGIPEAGAPTSADRQGDRREPRVRP